MASGKLKGNEALPAKMTLTVGGIDLPTPSTTISSWNSDTPMRFLRWSVLTLLILLTASPVALTQERQERPDRQERPQDRPARPERPAQARPADDAQQGPGVLRLLPPDAVSDKEITIGTRKIAYTATAGTLSLFDQSGEKSAAVFYTAYVAKGADAARRPLTFVFNGGPGAASVYLHLGVAGPRIVDFGPDGRDGAAAKLVDNPDSWLAFTDLVMIDPIGTGWSRTAKPDDAKASGACAATPMCWPR